MKKALPGDGPQGPKHVGDVVNTMYLLFVHFTKIYKIIKVHQVGPNH
jgi:hypothetical protein